MLDWDDLRVFSAVAAAGSVRRAAQQLGVHASTITRRLDQLEERLAVRLFTRTPAGLQLTPDGEEVVQRLERVTEDIGEIERRLRGRDAELAGEVRLLLPTALGLAFLVEELAAFHREAPGIELLLRSGGELAIARREVDLAIQVTNQPDENLVGRQLGHYGLAVYGPVGAAEPAPGGWIDFVPFEPLAVAVKQRNFDHLPVVLRSPHVTLCEAAIAHGMGLGFLPCALADRNPALRRLADVEPISAMQIWLLMSPDLRGVARVQALAKFLTERFAVHGERLAGTF